MVQEYSKLKRADHMTAVAYMAVIGLRLMSTVLVIISVIYYSFYMVR
jgi:hypothetical protein